MKKLLGIMALSLLLAEPVSAEMTIPWTKAGCESVNGNWITARSPTDEGCDANHCNGEHFCMSKQTMNWWSALIWCQWIGRELSDIETACPHSLSARRACVNLEGRMNVSGNNFSWLSTQLSNTGAYYLDASGNISTYHNGKTTDGWHHALCK